MSYLLQARLAQDMRMIDRVTACAASEGAADPYMWAVEHMWVLSAQPGWVASYASAVASGDSDPGANEGAVTDQMVLSAVQALLAE